MTQLFTIMQSVTLAALCVFLVKTTLLLLGAALGLFLARQASPAWRHRFCLFTLGSLLIFPLVLLTLPSWQIPGRILPALNVTAVTSSQAGAQHTLAFSPIAVLFSIWLTGTLICLARSAAGYLYAAYVARRATTCADPAWQEEFASIAEQIALSLDWLSLKVAHVSSPLAWGLRRATILIPHEALSWTPQKRRMVLLHELTHIERGDHRSLLFASFVRAIYWFHPLVWWFSSKLRCEQERACDEAVVSAGVSRTDYAELLLDSVRQLSSGALFGCAIFQQRNLQALRGRLLHVLHGSPIRYVSGVSKTVLPVFAIFLLGLATIQPVLGKGKIYRIGDGVEPPKLIHKVEPQYTKEASEAKIQGTLIMRIVVTADGHLQDIRIIKGLGSGLDQKAIEAVLQWKFKPGMLKGKPVPVEATVEMNFRLI